MNVFLIKLTSLPILIVIGIFERHLAAGQRFRESGVGVAYSLFQSLPRQIKNMPLIEALVGSSSNDMYEAIFDVDAGSDMDPFGDSDDEFGPALRSFPSRDYLEAPPTPTVKMRTRCPSSTRPNGSRRGSPRLQNLRPVSLDRAPDASATGISRSPLAVLFGSRSTSDAQATVLRAEASVRRVESLLEDIRELPVQKLKEEMKELQVGDVSYMHLRGLDRSIRTVKPVSRIFYLFSRGV